jgi:hypothetical protein
MNKIKVYFLALKMKRIVIDSDKNIPIIKSIISFIFFFYLENKNSNYMNKNE